MIYSILQIIKKFFRSLGIEISLYNPNASFIRQLIKSMETNKIDLVIDVGANKGQFAIEILNAGYKNKIISIEPLSSAYKQLIKNSKRHNNWSVLPRMALGKANKISKINISGNSVSSSLLPMLPAHIKIAPQSRYIKTEKVKINTLDKIAHKFSNYKNILLKIDAQGYESFILEGAGKLLKSNQLRGILIEVSFIKLYKKQKTFDYFYQLLHKNGFKIWAMEKGVIDNSNGRTLQADILAYKD